MAEPIKHTYVRYQGHKWYYNCDLCGRETIRARKIAPRHKLYCGECRRKGKK